jgi:[ribosomal protein S5]-alanine N-acetyltransferase
VTILETERLRLIPVTLAIVEAILADDVVRTAREIGARLPDPWPGRALIERAFFASIDDVRKDPEARLWGDRIALSRDDDPRLIGSVIFHGRPSRDGVVEVGYGIEAGSQGNGYASEALRAQVEWALTREGVSCVRATTPPWHQASIKVLERAGLLHLGPIEHEALGEVLLFERRR